MSEFTNARENRTSFRWQLLATASAIALIGAAFGASEAKAADGDNERPTLWIEPGGQLSSLNDGREVFAPAFPNSPPRPSIFSSPQKFEHPPHSSIDETGRLSFQPEGSDWVLSASVRYGRSGSNKHVTQRTNPPPAYWTRSGEKISSVRPEIATAARFADTRVQNSERHFIADFQAGKDVGLGMFGDGGSSVFNAGIRFAQFSTKSNIVLRSDPDWHFSAKYVGAVKAPKYHVYHSNAASLTATRSFHGVGPSLSWNASAPLLGAADRGEIMLDWGLNGAILFGRQRVKVQHHTTSLYHSKNAGVGFRTPVFHTAPPPRSNARTVTAPNVGAFAGLSFRVQNVKVSAGYRADLFFDAMDGGIDTAKKENVGFYGPFASVSVGIGG
jgi:iron complex outermembrane recepter protein